MHQTQEAYLVLLRKTLLHFLVMHCVSHCGPWSTQFENHGRKYGQEAREAREVGLWTVEASFTFRNDVNALF